MPNRVIHFEVQADDVNRAKEFYEKTFAWKIEQIMTKEQGGNMDYWGLDTGDKSEPGISGGLYQRTPDNKIYTFDCTILVEDIDKAIADVKANGGQITRDKQELKGVGWFAAGLDTEGNKFGLMQATDWQPQ